MGWTTRGTGRNYDSLTGYSVLIGYFTKKVLSFDIKNRKCRLCDLGHSSEDHECRKNFEGSAKSMEPASAVTVSCENPVLEDAKMQLGILISDNDSGTVAALRENSNFEVVKHSDKNHTSKGVLSQLYKLKEEKRHHKELKPDSMKYLQNCFNICVSQNEGNVSNMRKSIINIPEHAYNKHTNCDPSWCGYFKDKENCTHTIIGSGFKSEELYEDLKILFQNISNKAESYCANTSSNNNESFNHMYTSIAPKKCNYGLSLSGTTRLQVTVLRKNNRATYLESVLKRCNMKYGKNTAHYEQILARKIVNRYKKINN